MISKKLVNTCLFLIAICFIIAVKTVALYNDFSGMDAVWQLSAFWSFDRDVFWYNEFTQHSSEHYFVITYLLSPLLKLLGDEPVSKLYFLLYIINTLLLYQLRKPSTWQERALFIILITSPYFSQHRLEDVAITLLLSGLCVLQLRPNLSTGIYLFWMLIFPFIHPVTGIIGILVAFYFIFLKRFSKWSWVLVIGIFPWIFLYFNYSNVYHEQIGYRLQTDYFQLLIKSIPYLLPLIALIALNNLSKVGTLLMTIGLVFILIMGKAYYFENLLLIIFSVFFFQQNEIKNTQFNPLILACLTVALLLFPLNKLIQWIENPETISQELDVRKAIAHYTFDSNSEVFLMPGVSERLLQNSNVRFALYDKTLNELFTYRSLKKPDYLVVTDEEALQFIQRSKELAISSIDTIVSGNKGALLLSSGYTKRKNGVNLWVVKF